MSAVLDHQKLAVAFNDDHAFLAQFIESERLCRQRWRCRRRYLRDLENRGILPRAQWILGKLRYRLSDVVAAEAKFLADAPAEADRKGESEERAGMCPNG